MKKEKCPNLITIPPKSIAEFPLSPFSSLSLPPRSVDPPLPTPSSPKRPKTLLSSDYKKPSDPQSLFGSIDFLIPYPLATEMGFPSEIRDAWTNKRKSFLIPSPEEERILKAKHCQQEGVCEGFKAASIACVVSAVPTVAWNFISKMEHVEEVLIDEGTSSSTTYQESDQESAMNVAREE